MNMHGNVYAHHLLLSHFISLHKGTDNGQKVSRMRDLRKSDFHNITTVATTPDKRDRLCGCHEYYGAAPARSISRAHCALKPLLFDFIIKI